MGRNGRLHHDAGVFRVNTGGEEQSGDFPYLGPQFFGLLVDRDGVQIDDAEDAFVVVLNLYPVPEGTEIIADMEVAGRLNARQDARSHEFLGKTLC